MYTYSLNTHIQSCEELELYTHNIFSPSNPLVNEWDSCHNYPALWQVSISVSAAWPSTHIELSLAERDKTEPILATEANIFHSAAQFNKQTLPGHSQAFSFPSTP